jgi:hypothetical protein
VAMLPLLSKLHLQTLTESLKMKTLSWLLVESENTWLLVIGESFCSIYAEEESEVFTVSSGGID